MQLPSITVREVAEIRNNPDIVLLDVREPDELEVANLGKGVTHVPLSLIRERYHEALPVNLQDKDREIIVICHKGGRSAQVAAWLFGEGWTNVKNMEGGIDAYAAEIDPTLARY